MWVVGLYELEHQGSLDRGVQSPGVPGQDICSSINQMQDLRNESTLRPLAGLGRDNEYKNAMLTFVL